VRRKQKSPDATVFCLDHLKFCCTNEACHTPLDQLWQSSKMEEPRERMDSIAKISRAHLFGPWSERCCTTCHVMMHSKLCRLCGRLTEQYWHPSGNAFVRAGRRLARAMSGVRPVTKTGWRL